MDEVLKIRLVLFIVSIGIMSVLLFVFWDNMDFDLRISENVTNPYSKTSASQMFTVIIMFPISYSIIFSIWVLQKQEFFKKIQKCSQNRFFKQLNNIVYQNPMNAISNFLNYKKKPIEFLKFFSLCMLINFSIYYVILQFTVNDLVNMAKLEVGEILVPWDFFTDDMYVVDSIFFVPMFTLSGPLVILLLRSISNLSDNSNRKWRISKIILGYFYSVLFITFTSIILKIYFVPSVYAPEFFVNKYLEWFEYFVIVMFTYGLIISIWIFLLELKFFKKNNVI